MAFYESFIMFFTFFLLNTPIFFSLYRYVLRKLRLPARVVAGTVYWAAAIFTHELVPFIGVVILLAYVHRREEEEGWIRETDIWRIRPRQAVFAAAGALVFKVVISLINKLYVDLLSIYLGLSIEAQEIVKQFATDDLLYKLMLFLMVVMFAPFVEEYIFRYFIYDRLLLPRMPRFAAAVISSALFTLLHLNLSGIPTFFGLGLYCCYVYEQKGYFGAVIAHVASNLVTAALLM